jgi:hypothetical protein
MGKPVAHKRHLAILHHTHIHIPSAPPSHCTSRQVESWPQNSLSIAPAGKHTVRCHYMEQIHCSQLFRRDRASIHKQHHCILCCRYTYRYFDRRIPYWSTLYSSHELDYQHMAYPPKLCPRDKRERSSPLRGSRRSSDRTAHRSTPYHCML